MGFKDFFNRAKDDWKETKLNFQVGCQIMEPPSDPTSPLQRADRVNAGRGERQKRAEQARKDKSQREQNARDAVAKQRNNGGWYERQHGWTEDGNKEVTFKEGKSGENDKQTIIADGHLSTRKFNDNHNHYGPKREGGGRIEDDGGDRGKYTGPGS